MTTDRKGSRLRMPAIEKQLANKAKEAMEFGEKNLHLDWENTKAETCGVCKGSGASPFRPGRSCKGCEGTGKDFEFIYGMKGGKCYGYSIQYGHDHFLDTCKALREAEAENQSKRAGQMQLRLFKANQLLRMEYIAKGWDFDKLATQGDLELARDVNRNYKEFMTTNLISI